ncbi:MAG TPA: carboxyl transferase domain-containing protein, partial [Planctomycetota bacterium]|nr:carboxyl transferase domain-containing protein [Planctomycetota bacterium]
MADSKRVSRIIPAVPSGPKPAVPSSPSIPAAWKDLIEALRRDSDLFRLGGGQDAIDRQHKKNRLTARERIVKLCDPGTPFHEIGLLAAWKMYEEWGGAPSAGVITGVGRV